MLRNLNCTDVADNHVDVGDTLLQDIFSFESSHHDYIYGHFIWAFKE